MKPVAKAKRKKRIEHAFDKAAQKKWEREIDHALMDLDEQVEERYKYAKEIYDIQDSKTKDALDFTLEAMKEMAGEPRFTFRGITINAEPSLLQSIQERNLFWIAIRVYVACAAWDIRLTNFKLPTNTCAKCGRKVK